jgi:hypothetical protein
MFAISYSVRNVTFLALVFTSLAPTDLKLNTRTAVKILLRIIPKYYINIRCLLFQFLYLQIRTLKTGNSGNHTSNVRVSAILLTSIIVWNLKLQCGCTSEWTFIPRFVNICKVVKKYSKTVQWFHNHLLSNWESKVRLWLPLHVKIYSYTQYKFCHLLETPTSFLHARNWKRISDELLPK